MTQHSFPGKTSEANPYESPQTASVVSPRKTSPKRIVIWSVGALAFFLWTCGVYCVGYLDGWEQGFGGDATRPPAKGRVLVPDEGHKSWFR